MLQVNETSLSVDVLESDVGPINKAKLHLALTVAAFLVEDEVRFKRQHYPPGLCSAQPGKDLLCSRSLCDALSRLQINKGILKDGFALPDIPHVTVERANVTVAKAALALGSDVKYAG